MPRKDLPPSSPSQQIDFLEEIANFTFTSKYARYNEKEKRRETWEETVARLERMHLKRFSYLSKEDVTEVRWAFDQVRAKLVAPSMRSLQFGGKGIEAHHVRCYNCSVRHIDSLRAFAEVFYLLLCGSGVGIGLSNRFLDRLPDLVDADDKSGTVVTYVISDTIEGWADSVEALLMCYFKNTPYTGRKVVFDYSKIRKKGAPLKTGGGKAPGYKGLKQAHQRIKGVLDYVIEEENQRRLKTINAYDILMHAADAVLSGGIRRSATSVVFDPDDEDMMTAKTFFKVDKVRRFAKDDETGQYHGQVVIRKRVYDVVISEKEYSYLKVEGKIGWSPIEPQRARSNNSVLLLRDKVTKEQFAAIVEKTRQFGEPGFVFASHPDTLYNPCLRGDTLLQVRQSGQALQLPIAGLEGREVEVWNGEVWSKTTIVKTGVNQPLLKVQIHRRRVAPTNVNFQRSTLYVTPYHRFYLADGSAVEACQLRRGDKLETFRYPNGDIGECVVEDVVDEGESADVYCCNEPLRHRIVVNEVLTGQCFEISFIPNTLDGVCGVQMCNLTTQNGRQITSKERFRDATKAATIIGTLQAAYTDFPYLSPAARKLTEQEALLGVSITGIMENPDILLDPVLQREMAAYAVEVNKAWAVKVGINPAARITCVKPEGTTSLVLKTSSGIHPHHARRYFRRIQCNRTDNVFRHFRKVNPHAVEEGLWSATKTDDVVTFPLTIPERAMIKADLSALKHLEYIRSTQQNWVIPGTTSANTKPIEHNVSCTVTVKDEEWQGVIDYLYDNRMFFAAVSLLPAIGDKLYKQAPNEAVVTPEDEARWAALVDAWKTVDYTGLTEEDDETQMMVEQVCGGGQCEVR